MKNAPQIQINFAAAYYWDMVGGNHQAIEENYQLAIKAYPDNKFFRFHYIRYLFARGQITQVKKEWSSFIPLLDPENYNDVRMACVILDDQFNDLRVWKMLDELSQFNSLWAENKDIQLLKEKLEIYRYVDEAKADLYPTFYMSVDWYEKGPKLLPRKNLESWSAGRITEKKNGKIYIQVATKDKGELRVFVNEWSLKDWKKMVQNGDGSCRVDQFFEAGQYKEDGNSVIRIHVFPESNPAMLMNWEFPDSNRFFLKKD